MAVPCVNSDNFLAVALVVNRSRDGPAFVFHYPAKVQYKTATSEGSDLEDILLERLSQPASHHDSSIGGNDLPSQWDRDDHILTDSGSQIVPWEHVVGFPTNDLAGILTPARCYHKTLFQLNLDPLCCISYPIHVPENGKWKKQKKASKAKDKDKDKASTVVMDDSQHSASNEAENSSGMPEPKEKDGKKEEDEEKRSSMTMFNLVFILNPKTFESKELIESLYHNIVKKAMKAYKYSQQQSDFIWKESKRILAHKDKAREERKRMTVLWKEILQMSSLASSMADIYNAVSQNKIAALHLETALGVLTPSFQIPVPFYIADLPPDADAESTRGLWLTTANAFLSQDTLEEPGFLDRNFALLLMDDEKKIIAELQTDPDPTTASMIEFVRLSKPTMTFHQVAQSNVLTLSQVRKYAQHFIYWRRAIAIPPLHARDVYIVSPNCDPRRLPPDALEWQRLFPVAPPLPNFLGELSQSPKPYKHFCPSKAHRPSYLLMLAWLMRRGWVTQLCTFAHVVVWPEILYEVDYEIEAEELASEQQSSSTPTIEEEAGPISPTTIVSEHPPPSASSDVSTPLASTTEATAEAARLDRLATKARSQATERIIAHSRRTPPLATAHPSLNDAAHLKGYTPHIILDAKKATGKEAKYLSAIAKRMKDDKVRSAWRVFSKYFDGRCALERVALQEEMKRKEVWGLLTSMTEYLLCTRHW